ncbi:alpha/beta hydrolase [Actinotalea ferrariae]|uniref:esterase/lipase family protein n=1 Tax=Actinotalea ferrariae TaxID=1386098 RepID=UPI001C8BC5FC|nr:alpha/beta hydrolase [Actinotalea ferrariae]MBX9244249.1 alpha/beta hydrolase [Actinotalea ferrariae]
MTPGAAAARAVRFVAPHARHAWWRTLDYAYVLVRQAEGALRRGGAEAYLEGSTPPDVVLVPGVYESWPFMRPIAQLLHGHGHAVHVLPALGYNIGPVPAAASVLGAYLTAHDLRDVVVVAHSKGGLIGKRAMLREDPDGRIRSMVAINTPFAGSAYARWIPLASLRIFRPDDATLLELGAEQEVNSRITSVYAPWDPHIPGGSVLPGAANVELETPGHFRPLADPRLERVLLAAVRGEGGQPSEPPAGAESSGA